MESKNIIVVFNGVKIKPGYIIRILTTYGLYTNDYLVYPVSENFSKYQMAMVNLDGHEIVPIEEFQYEKDIIAIYGLMEDKSMITSGETLWEKPKIVTITKQEIADKFGIDINLIKIE